jgi:type I restriction enzyme S subunit
VIVDRVRIGELLRLERRPVQVDPSDEYIEVGIRSFGRGIFHKEPVRGSSLGSKRVFRIEPNDLVISNVFAWEGAVAVASKDEIGKIGSHRFMTFVPADDRIDVRWASWLFRSEPGLELIRKASPGSAGRNRTLAIDRFEALEISLLPIEEQRRVAAELEHIEDAANGLRWHVARASELNEALAVSSAIRPELSDAAKSRIGWAHTPLAGVVTPSSSQLAVDPANDYLIAGIYSFGKGLIDRGPITGSDTSYTTLTRLDVGDIVVSKLNGWEGAVAVVDESFVGFHVSSEYPVFVPDRDRILPEFFAGIARAPSFWEQLNTNARGSMVRRRRINPKEFLATRVWLPPMEVQRHLGRVIQGAGRIGEVRGAVATRIDALLPAALNRVFGGPVDVKTGAVSASTVTAN